MTQLLAAALLVYLSIMFAIGWWARGRVHTSEDYLVAGRRLPLSLAWPTLLATWFGAGTLLTATDEVRAHGLRMAALDPLGAGLCLLMAGWWIARPLWEMKLLTLSDFFARRFDRRVEVLSAILLVPTYLGWIAAQFVALAALLHLYFDIPVVWGIALVAVVGTSYTLVGGMWSVTLTDVIQMALVATGLVVLTGEVLVELGGSVAGGWSVLAERLPAHKRVLVPHDSAADVVGWLGVLAVGSLGNLPGQDLLQRVFASRSARTAVRACHLAGASYLVLGALPLTLGLSADLLVPESSGRATVGLLAEVFLSPTTACILMLAIVSAVLSTIDSAILSPASVVSQNLLRGVIPSSVSDLTLNRGAVLGIAAMACVTAYVGESAYEMLESAYSLGLVALLVPLLAGVGSSKGGPVAALAAMVVGTALWSVHLVAGWEVFLPPILGTWSLPMALTSAGCAALTYALVARREPSGRARALSSPS